MHYELIDEQTKVEEGNASFYNHLVRSVNETTGLGAASQIQIDFDPVYQNLVFHRLDIVRGGRRISKLGPKAIKFLQRETRLENRSYDGKLTASIVLDDVRVGDKIEYTYTISGMNPVFDGKFVFVAWAAAEKGPVTQYQFRLLAPEGRTIRHRAGPDITVTSSVSGGVRETLFRRHSFLQLQGDELTPASAYFGDQVQLSEFSDWAEVAAWGRKLFQQQGAAGSGVRKIADDIRAVSPDAVDRVTSALDFVQKQIRYFGMEFGTSSHRPAAPSTVIAQRFGDCKDKTVLLAAILGELNVDAVPVLVPVYFRSSVSDVLPSPLAFDHAILHVSMNGKSYWLDGTRGSQTGPLSERQSVGLGKGLLLQSGTTGLTELPDFSAEERVTVDESFSVAKFSDDLPLETTITYYGEMAEMIRDSIAAQSTAPLESQLQAEYGRFYSKMHNRGPLRVEEVQGHNAVRIVQQFMLPQFWRFPDEKMLTGDLPLWNFSSILRYPTELNRKKPLRVVYPGVYRHNIAFDFNENVYRARNADRFDDSNRQMSFHLEYELGQRSFRIASELRLLQDTVAPDEWSEFNTQINKIRQRLMPHITAPAVTIERADKLKLDIDRLSEAIQSGKEKVTTRAQVSARFKVQALTAQLDSGRLNPALRAQALRARGENFDHLGYTATAARDFAEALKLAPEDAENHGAAAINAFLEGKDVQAVEYADKALKLAPSDRTPLHVRAFANYYMGNFKEAKQDLLTLLKNRSDVERSYAAIWLYLVSGKLGENPREAVAPYLPSSSAPWPADVLRLMIGKTDYQQAYKAALGDKSDSSQLCELYFYLGEKYLLDGERRRAQEYYQKAIDTNVVEFNEYQMARRSLSRIADR